MAQNETAEDPGLILGHMLLLLLDLRGHVTITNDIEPTMLTYYDNIMTQR